MKRQELVIRHFRWEFLRRGRAYREDVDDLSRKFTREFPTKTAFWYLQLIGRRLPEPLEKRIGALRRKWDVSAILPYEWRFDSNGRYEYRPGFFAELPASYWQISTGYVNRMDNAEDYAYFNGDTAIDFEEWMRELYLNLHVSVAGPIRATLDEIEREIRQARVRFREKYSQLPRGGNKSRMRLNEYDLYLKVWDLRQERKTYRQISETLYPVLRQNSCGPLNQCVTKIVQEIGST